MAVVDLADEGELNDAVAEKLMPVLATGVHDSTLGFTTAYFHTAAELHDEVSQAGFADVVVLGIEGPAGMVGDREGPGGITQGLRPRQGRRNRGLRSFRIDRPTAAEGRKHDRA